MIPTQLGMPVLMEYETLEQHIDLCKELGLQFIELNVNYPEYNLEALADTVRFRRAAEENGVYFTLHLDEYLNPTDFNPMIAEAHCKTVLRAIACAREIGIPVLNMHMFHGVYMTMPDRKVQLFEQYSGQYLAAIRRFRDLCVQEIGKSDITIAIENVDGFTPVERQAIELLLESDRFALTIDAGHLHKYECVDKEFMEAHEDRVRHYHLHTVENKLDHQPVVTDDTDAMQYVMTAGNKNRRCLIEVRTEDAVRASVEWLEYWLGVES